MDDFIMSVKFLYEDVEITVTEQEGFVDLNFMHLDGAGREVISGASLSPKLAQKLGGALQEIGYDAGREEENLLDSMGDE